MSRLVFILLTIAALALPSPIRLQAWEMRPAGLQRVAIPAGSLPIHDRVAGDMDRDGEPESLQLARGQLRIQTDGRTRWSSPEEWKVEQALLADLDGDERLEAILLVSRPFQPWPVDAWLPHGGRIDSFQDAQGYSSHIILIGWMGRKFDELWAGSAMAQPVKSIAVVPLNGKRQQLVTLEGEYSDPPLQPARRLKVWEWNGFGFGLVSVLDGPFRRMTALQSGERRFLILEP